METPNVHFLTRVWLDGKTVCMELDFLDFFEPEFILSLKPSTRTIADWWEESMREDIVGLPECFLPENFEVCEEPVLLEVIGVYSAQGWTDADGEYDEDFTFEIINWTAAIDDSVEEEARAYELRLLKELETYDSYKIEQLKKYNPKLFDALEELKEKHACSTKLREAK